MPARRHHQFSVDDYLAYERSTPGKHEYADGQVLAMAGGSPRHNAISANVLRALGNRIAGGPCVALSSDQRIRTPDGLYTYADGSVFCGGIELGPEATAANPTLLVEVLSDSTREYDRGEKLERYRGIPSLRHVLLIDQARTDVEHWFRAGDGWARRVHTADADEIGLDALGLALPIAEIYAGTASLP